ncbi:MAG: hypothetical protein RQ752_14255, partial [Thermohalobaculum sp.]|nr:hypothetical protein [Thermohalobaculum sp.]
MPNGSTPDAVLRDSLKASLSAAALRLTDAHVDLRLPDRIMVGEAPLAAAMAALCRWLDQAAPTRRRGLALWVEGEAAAGAQGGPLPLLLEASRACAGAPAASRSTAPADPGLVAAAAHLGAEIVNCPGRAGAVERLALRFTAHAAVNAWPLAHHWGGALAGRRLLVLREAALDPVRVVRSFGALSLAARIETDPDEALEAARSAVRDGLPYDFALVCASTMGEAAAATLRALRTLPGGGPRIVLVSQAQDDPALARLADSVVPQRRHWRRVIDAIFDLAHAAGRPTTAAPASIPAFGGRRILIAEDVRTNQALLRAMLAPTGATVAVAANGAEAVKAMQAAPADLVL